MQTSGCCGPDVQLQIICVYWNINYKCFYPESNAAEKAWKEQTITHEWSSTFHIYCTEAAPNKTNVSDASLSQVVFSAMRPCMAPPPSGARLKGAGEPGRCNNLTLVCRGGNYSVPFFVQVSLLHVCISLEGCRFVRDHVTVCTRYIPQ